MRLAPCSCFIPFLLGGQADLPGGPVRRLEDDDLLAALGHDAGGLQPRRAGADDGDVTRCGRRRDVGRHRLFAACRRIVQAESHAVW